MIRFWTWDMRHWIRYMAIRIGHVSHCFVKYQIVDHLNSVVHQPEPMGFVIQRAVGYLRIAMHRLEMDSAHGTMSPEEAFARQRVLQSTHELLLAIQLIAIPQLST